jgi:hypothetical protein
MKRALTLALGGLFLAACGSDSPPVLTATLASKPPGPGLSLGGSIDTVVTDEASGLVTIEGWHMFTQESRRHDLKVYAAGAEAVSSVAAVARPDVAEAVGNEELANAGFQLVLRLKPGASLDELCISFDDKHYGARLLNPHSPDQVRCTSLGQ